MNSEETAAAYRELSSKYHTDAWTEPIGVTDHLEALSQVLESGGDYSTTFEYDRSAVAAYADDWSAFRDDLRDADMSELIRDRVIEEIQEKLECSTLLTQGGDEAYTEFQRQRIGLPEPELVAMAQTILDGDLSVLPFHVCASEDGEESITSAHVQSLMSQALGAYGLEEWYAVEEPNMAARASVNGSLHRVRVRQGTLFTQCAADRLLAHEIGGHVLRWANSQNQPEAWASIALGRTVATEEGMAAWREVQFNLLTEEQIRVYAARVIAVDTAQKEGLLGVARRIADFVDPQQAAEIAVRTKRGLKNPDNLGGMTKDWGYLAGLLAMADLAQNAPDNLRLLAGVKWPVDDLPLICQLHKQGAIVEPELVPDRVRLGLSSSTSQ